MKIYKSLDNEDLANGIKSGKVAVIPTDTIYGLVASATNEKSVRIIYEIKNRAPEKPFIILISDIGDLEEFNVSLPIELLSQLSDYWPGPNSLILSCDDQSYDYLCRGTESLAFRMPENKLLRDFLRKTGPLVAPSANPEGQKPSEDINDAIDYFANQVDYYVDAGKISGQPSNLIDFTSGTPVKLR